MKVVFPWVYFACEKPFTLKTEELVFAVDGSEERFLDKVFIKMEALFLDEEVNVREFGEEKLVNCLRFLADIANGDLMLS